MPFRFETPVAMLLASLPALCAVAIWMFRGRPRRGVLVLLILGALCIVVAAGTPRWNGEQRPRVAVMIDASPSMRGALFQNAEQRLRRLTALLPASLDTVEIDTFEFACERRRIAEDKDTETVAAVETIFDPPTDADAVILFSDGRFKLPDESPPIFAVIDPSLDDARDASISGLTIDRGRIRAAVYNFGAMRMVSAVGRPPTTAPTGKTIVDLGPSAGKEVSATLNAVDRWPENDMLRLRAAPPVQLERWWIGMTAAPEGWRSIRPGVLPDRPGDYLGASMIVLDNVPAEEVTAGGMEALSQYVRQFGGTLTILGGEHAFAAGGYGGTPLDALSPLASDPPTPQRLWLLLADSSGSMGASINGRSRWELATGAVTQALRMLPENDRVNIGDFAGAVRWWSQGKTVKTTRGIASLVPTIGPQGPTNLQSALAQIGESPDPTEVLLVTDGQTQIDDVKSLAADFVRRKIRVHLLALSQADDANVVVQLVRLTGGSLIVEADSSRWSDAARRLARGIAPARLAREEGQVSFDPSLALGSRMIAPRNLTWLRDGAMPFANAADGSVAAARWRVGLGNVAAFAFTPTGEELEATTLSIEQRPRDPRFQVRWEIDADVQVTVDAEDAGKPMNDLTMEVELMPETGGSGRLDPLPQTAPGRYAASFPAEQSSVIATVRAGGSVIDRRAIAGRYPREFEQIGNDRQSLRQLADLTGGRVIEPADSQRIAFPHRRRTIPLTSQFSLAGATMLVLGLIVQRRGSVR